MKTARSAIVITNCTGRKLHISGPVWSDPPRQSKSLEAMADGWKMALRASTLRHMAADLYAGRTFREAESVAESLSAPLYVVSAGLGLTAATDLVPAYDLTVSETGASVLPALRRLGLETRHWWAAINSALDKPSPITSLMRANPEAIMYVAMPSTYLALVGEELASIPRSDLSRLRIFSSSAWQREAPSNLAPYALPYDERLETTEFDGTRNDFPQRALHHFIRALRGHALNLKDGRAAVATAMTSLNYRVLPERQKRTDEEIRSLLRLHWTAQGGLANRLLRMLRDELLIKCEQSRFRDLWRDVSSEME